jgi:hypothetical protein
MATIFPSVQKLPVYLLSVLFLLQATDLSGRTVEQKNEQQRGVPSLSRLDLESHDVNAVYLMVSNQGPIGLNIELNNGTGFFPANTPNNYVFGTGLWFGAKYDADSDGDLDKVYVQGYNPRAGDSEFREGNNNQDPDDPLTRVFDSTEQDDLADWPDPFRTIEGEPFVRSDQDLVTTYTTRNKLPVFGSFQMPIQVNQRSMAFKTGLAAQAIFIILDVENFGEDVLENAWIGYDNDMDVGTNFQDDLTSFIVNRITPEEDTIRVNMAYAWDSDFEEENYTGDPGFVGIAYLRSPGNPFDGIDNDGDGLIDESPFDGVDNDIDPDSPGYGEIDDPFEVDELGLVNYSKHCNATPGCEVNDPQTDEEGYDLISCIGENNPDSSSSIVCLESTTPSDIRFMMSSGPFDWLPGQTQQVVLAMVFANSRGDRSLSFIGDPPRPDPNDDDLIELLEVKDVIQGVFDLNFLQAGPPPAPNMTLMPGDGQVTILWDDLPLRTADRTYEEFVELDSTYREYDFQGFRIWRSRTGTFSRRGDVNSPDFPLTPEAIEENRLVPGFDLELLAQYDLVDGIVTIPDGITCSDSIILDDGEVHYTVCDTFDLGDDVGLRFSYVDQGEANVPLINGFRYFYSVTAYDYNSDVLPVSRLSLDSGVSFPAENSTIPRSYASSYMDAVARLYQVSAQGETLDDSSSIFSSAESGELVPLDEDRASNALTAFLFTPGDPEKISDEHYTFVLERFERIGTSTNRIHYTVENTDGDPMSTGAVTSFDLSYDGIDKMINLPVFDPDDTKLVLFTSNLTFNVDASAFVANLTRQFHAENRSGVVITDSLGSLTTGGLIPACYRATDLRVEWVDAGPGSLTVNVTDLDYDVEIPFGENIVPVSGQTNNDGKGHNWSFLPVIQGIQQPGGRYFLTTASLKIADLWLGGIRLTTTLMDRMPMAGDVWYLRQQARTQQIDDTVDPPDTTYLDAQRPPVPGTRYRIDTVGGGPDKGSVDLTKIRVVPNPYLATSSFELGPTQKRIEFINLPPECTIRIYTISGNLVEVLNHTPDEGGTEVYNLRTRYNLSLASGNYYYHVTTPGGETHLGRFAIVQ